MAEIPEKVTVRFDSYTDHIAMDISWGKESLGIRFNSLKEVRNFIRSLERAIDLVWFPEVRDE